MKLSSVRSSAFECFRSNLSLNQTIDKIYNGFEIGKPKDSFINDFYQNFYKGQIPQVGMMRSDHYILFCIFNAYSEFHHMVGKVDFPKRSHFTQIVPNTRLIMNSSPDGSFVEIGDSFNGNFKCYDIYPPLFYGYKWHSTLDMQILDNEHFVQLFWGNNLDYNMRLLKIDTKREKIHLLNKIQSPIWHHFCLNEKNSKQFVVCDILDKKMMIGEFGKKGRGSIDEVNVIPHGFFFIKFVGAKLYGFCLRRQNDTNVLKWNYCEYDLETRKSLFVECELPETAKNQKFEVVTEKSFPPYHWSKDKLFIAHYHRKWSYFYLFDMLTQDWKSIDIYIYGAVKSFCLDKNDVLIAYGVHEDNGYDEDYYDDGLMRTYRFALRKPESFLNITQIAIRRSKILFKTNIYDKVKSCFPKNSEFHFEEQLNKYYKDY